MLIALCVCYLVQVNEDAGDRVQEAGQLVEAFLLAVRLSQVHLFAPLDQLRVHQLHVFRTNLLTRLQRKKYLRKICPISTTRGKCLYA